MPSLFGRTGRHVLAALLAFVLVGCGGGSTTSGSDGSVVSQASAPASTTGSIDVITPVAAGKLPATTASLRISLMQGGALVVAAGLTNPSTFPATAGKTSTNRIANVPPGTYTVLVEAFDANGTLLGLAPPTTSVVPGRTAEVVVNELFTIKTIAVTPATVALPPGATQALSATATLSNGSPLVVTLLGTWTSGTPATATVSSKGVVTAVAAGTSTVTLTYGGASGASAVTVSGGAPSPSPSPSPTPSPSTVNMTTTKLDSWQQTASGLSTADYAYDPATQTGVLVGSSGIVVTIDATGASHYREINKLVNLRGVAFLAGKGFVAVGSGGTIVWSADGSTWTAATTNPVPNTVLLQDVCAYTNGTASGFIAVGQSDGTHGWIVHSTDGKTWTDISVGANNVNYTAVACGLIGVTYQVEVLSDTASQCQHQGLAADTAPTTNGWSAIATSHAGMRAIAYAQSAGTGFFVASGDAGWVDINAKGDAWASASTAQIAGQPNIRGVAYGRNGTTDTISFVANGGVVFVDNTFSAANTGHSYVAGSMVFPSGTSPAYTGTPSGRVRYTNGLFYATGGGNALLRGVDGQAYEVVHYSSGSSVEAVACGMVNGAPLYVAVGDPDLSNPFGANKALIMTSPDGVTWTQQDPGVLGTSPVYAVCYGNGRFVAVSMDGKVGISTDGVTWTAPTTNTMGSHNYMSVTYAPTAQRFVASGMGWIAVSTDGTADSWSDAAKGLAQGFCVTTGTVGGTEMFVQCGLDGGKSAISWATDPTAAWTNVQLAQTEGLSSIAFNNGMFVAVGESGRVETSTDGKTFTDGGTIGTQSLNAVTGVTTPDGSGSFVGWIAVGNGGVVFTSTNGLMWTPAATQSSTTQVLRGIAFDTSVNTSIDPVTNVTTNVYSTRFVVGGVNTTMLRDL